MKHQGAHELASHSLARLRDTVRRRESLPGKSDYRLNPPTPPRFVLPVIALAVAAAAGVVSLRGSVPGLPGVVLMLSLILSLMASAGVEVTTWILLVSYLTGMFLANRAFALLGVYPVFVPDLLLLLGIAVSLPVSIQTLGRRELRPFRLPIIFVFIAGAVGLLRGLSAGHESALKGAILGIYPLAALLVAALLLARPRAIQRLPLWLWLSAPAGAIAALALPIDESAASAGLALSISGSVGLSRRDRAGNWLVAATCAGALALAADAKRGPILAILAALVATYAARGGKTLPRSAAITAIVGTIAAAGLFLSITKTSATEAPVVGAVVNRVVNSFDPSGGEPYNNVTLRFQIWHSTLQQANTSPFVGLGAGAALFINVPGIGPLALDSGPHNSFLGYAFYLGYPAAIAVIFILSAAIHRSWRLRRSHPMAPAVFGALVAVVVTAMTNDAFETTFVGGVAWLVIGAAASLAVRGAVPDQSLTHRAEMATIVGGEQR